MSGFATRFAAAMQEAMSGKAAQTLPTLLRLAQQAPNEPDVNHGIALVCLLANDGQRGLFYADKAIAGRAGDGNFHNTRGQLLVRMGRADDAEKAFRRSIELDSTVAPAWLGLANLELGTGRTLAASHTIVAGLAATNSHPGLAGPAAAFLLIASRADEALRSIEPIAREHPHDALLQRNVAVASNFASGQDPREVFDRHVRHGRSLAMTAATPNATSPSAAITTPDPARRLRVGLFSPDFRRHSVAYFVEPLLTHAPKDRLEFVAYSNLDPRAHDAVTARLKPHFAHWRDTIALTDDQLIATMHKDGLDALVDLAGLTDGGRMGAIARRPAPVVATYLGYANTTGIAGLDARFVDSHTDPSGAESLATEPLVRLDPCFLCFQPPPESPPESSRAPNTSGPIVFGSFNAIAKINDELLAIWSRVLAAVPGSLLALKAQHFKDASLRDRALARCVAAGIAADRVRVLPPPDALADHLAAYAEVHIALDTFPFHGTTTTCEALWMGVPVVTMAGQTHASRVGVSLLHAVGLDDLVAPDVDGYVSRAVALASDSARRADLRATLRERVAKSPLCDGIAFAARFERAIRSLCETRAANTGGRA